MREPTSVCPAREGLIAAVQQVRFGNPALDHDPIQLKPLPQNHQTELVDAVQDSRGRVP